MPWYVIALIVSSALFLISTIASVFWGDIDLDVDIDNGFLLSDFISFKGLLHFAFGFSLTLTLMQGVTLVSVSVGVITGIIFVVVLYYLYKLVFDKLQQTMKYTTKIESLDAEIYFWDKKKKIGEVFVTLEGRPVTITLECPEEEVHFEKGQHIKVSGTRQAVYPVEYII